MQSFLNPIDKSVDLITLALREDLIQGDITTSYFPPANTYAKGYIVARQHAILSGIDTTCDVLLRVDPSLKLQKHANDGDSLTPNRCVLEISGQTSSILAAERTSLNFLQRLSGVATLTKTFVDTIKNTRTKILDTRKTTPGFRMLEKAAVRHGGGVNHRLHLGDAVIVKDNHLASLKLSGIQEMIDHIKKTYSKVDIILEVDTLDQLDRFLKLSGITRILLDNMNLEQLKRAVEITNHKLPLEASGGVNLKTVRGIAETGVDFISIGSLTHSAVAVDFGLDFEIK